MLFLVAAMAAEMERDLIRERTLDGLAAAHAQGRRGGRPALWTPSRDGSVGDAARVLIATVRTMIRSWDAAAPGVLRLPSGLLIRGRGLGRPLPAGPWPTFAVHLLEYEPPAVPWDTVWVYWPDFGLPDDHRHLRSVLTEAWRRAEAERVEVACWGGRGRTGTALACLSVLDGLPADQAVAYVRSRYDAEAIETMQQERFVTRSWV